jgi:hypothetical protein
MQSASRGGGQWQKFFDSFFRDHKKAAGSLPAKSSRYPASGAMSGFQVSKPKSRHSAFGQKQPIPRPRGMSAFQVRTPKSCLPYFG